MIAIAAPSEEGKSIEELLLKHLPRLRKFACKLINTSFLCEVMEPDDLLHDAVLKITCAASRFDSRIAGFKTWAFQILFNTFKQANRNYRSHRKCTLTVDSLDSFTFPNLKEEDRSPNRVFSPLCIESEYKQKEFYNLLEAALRRLPAEQRLAFVAYEISDLTSLEAAAVLKIPCATLRSRVFRARQALAKDPRIQALRP